MNTPKKILIGAGIVMVGAVAVIAASPTPRTLPVKKVSHIIQRKTPQRKAPPKAPRKTPAKIVRVPHSPQTPVIPSAGQNSVATAQASLAALVQKEKVTTPTGPIDIVANLAQPTQKWAFATLAAKGASTGYTLWFGEQNTPNGPWTWIPSTLPGALSPKLPPAVYAALQWAWDLNQGQTGPMLLGTVSWSTITGHVGMPEAWTAQESNGQLTLTVWEPSETGIYSGYYGVESAWYADTIAAGKSGLTAIVPGGAESLAELAAH